MDQLSSENEEILRLFIIFASSIGAILTSIFSMTHGIFEVFPFLYILPIILCVYFYPRRAVMFSLGISILYIGIIYVLGFSNATNIAISTAWFAIFITIGVVASSYANRLLEEKNRIKNILDNTQDGIFCFDPRTTQILEVNSKCAKWLRYGRKELVGKTLSAIWPDDRERNRFIEETQAKIPDHEVEALFRSHDGTILRFAVAPIMVANDKVLCSAIDLTGSAIIDEEIRRTLDELEDQVRARTADLERINEELRAEILEHRRFESQMISQDRRKGEKVDK